MDSTNQTVTSAEPSLTVKMAAIGIMVSADNLSRRQIDAIDIEATIADAIVEVATESADPRLPSLILTWVAEHGSCVIVEKLEKLLRHRRRNDKDTSFTALCAAVAIHHGHKRWRPLVKRYAPKKPRTLGPSELAESLIRMRGVEDWSQGTGFRVPKGSVEIKRKWVLDRAGLAESNHQYRNRLVFGAQWRADIITAIQRGASTPTEVARMSGASYEPCHRVMSELSLAGWPSVILSEPKKKGRAA